MLAQIKQAAQQLTNQKILLGESDGSKWLTAIAKAKEEARFNSTIKFDGELLAFFSRESGKLRNVTKFGCHESCDCKGGISYHRALFEILSTAGNVLQFPMKNHIREYSTEKNLITVCDGCNEAHSIGKEADAKYAAQQKRIFIKNHLACEADFLKQEQEAENEYQWSIYEDAAREAA